MYLAKLSLKIIRHFDRGLGAMHTLQCAVGSIPYRDAQGKEARGYLLSPGERHRGNLEVPSWHWVPASCQGLRPNGIMTKAVPLAVSSPQVHARFFAHDLEFEMIGTGRLGHPIAHMERK